jgi:uncharacterized protein YecT (DUF1311 family)
MRPLLIACVVALLTAPAVRAADIGAMIAERCGAELTAQGQAACLSVLTEDRMATMNRTLAELTGQVQGAGARALRAFERDMRTAQRIWKQSAEADCRATTGLTAGPRRNLVWRLCMLEKAVRREAELQNLIRLSFDHLGGQPGASQSSFVPDEVEIFIPLGALEKRGKPAGVYFGVPLNRRPFQ